MTLLAVQWYGLSHIVKNTLDVIQLKVLTAKHDWTVMLLKTFKYITRIVNTFTVCYCKNQCSVTIILTILIPNKLLVLKVIVLASLFCPYISFSVHLTLDFFKYYFLSYSMLKANGSTLYCNSFPWLDTCNNISTVIMIRLSNHPETQLLIGFILIFCCYNGTTTFIRCFNGSESR